MSLAPTILTPMLRSLLALVLAATALGAQTLLPYEKVRRFIQEFEQIHPPPPPVEPVEVGTLDATTGGFVWGPEIGRKESGETNPAFTPVFEELRLPPLAVQLPPQLQVTGLLPRVQAALPRYRPAPGGRGADPRLGGPPAVRQPGPFTGNSLGRWKYYATVRAGHVLLVCKIANRPAGAKVTLTVDGRSAEIDGDQVDLLIPPRVVVEFQLRCGAAAFTDRIWFERPPVLGFFQLEALPITVVYEPPGSGSAQSYGVSEQLGTTLRSFSSGNEGEERPVPTNFSNIADFMGVVAKAGEVVAAKFPAVGEAMKKADDVFKGLFGEQERSSTVTHTVTEEHSLAITLTESTTVATRSGLGPGRGDMIWYLYHPVFAWLAAQDENTGRVYLTVTLLSFQRAAAHSAEALRNGTVPEPNADMRRLLLAHDVLTPEHRTEPGALFALRRGRGATPGELRRLVPAEAAEQEVPAGGAMHLVFERSVTDTDTCIETTTKTVTTTESAGFLAMVSPGLPKDRTTEVSITTGTARTVQTGRTVRVDVTLAGKVDEARRLRCWYDRRSGTFAYEEVPYGAAGDPPPNPVARAVAAPQGSQGGAGGTGKSGNAASAGEPRAADPAPHPGATPAEAFVLRAAEGLSKRMGRLIVNFPEAAPASGTLIALFEADGRSEESKGGAPKPVASNYGNSSLETFPGEYAVVVGGKRLEGVRIEGGRETVLQVGTLRVNAADGTRVDILDAPAGARVPAGPQGRLRRTPAEPPGRARKDPAEPISEVEIVGGYGTFSAGLPAGTYLVRVHGRVAPVEIVAGQVTEF